MNRLFRSLMLSTFILSNVLTPLSYANLEEDLFEDDLLSKSGQKIIETQVINNSGQSINDNTKDGSDINSGTENTESTSKNINNNEETNSENLSKPENDITISEEVTSNDGCYTFNTDTQTIISYNCTDTDIEIPSTISGVDVKIIGQGVFYGKGIVSVKIPDTVEEIQKQAFRGTNQKKTLSNIEFGNNIKIIGEESFAVNPLSTVILPQSVTTISKNAFLRNSADPVIGILLGKNSVNSNASDSHLQIIRGYKVTYKDGNDIYKTSVTTGIVENLPGTKEGYELVGWYTDSELSNSFDFTQTITADTTLYGKWDKIYTDECYTFNESTQTITDYNASCGNKVVIPSSFDDVEVKIIGESAFYNKGLISVSIPDTVEEIQKNAFLNNSLTTVNLGESVSTIGGSAFQGNQLQNVYIPNSVTKIWGLAFAYNQNPSVPCSQGGTDRGNGVIGISLIDGKTYGGCVNTVKGYKVNYIDSGVVVKTTVTTGIVEDYGLDTKEGYLFDAWYKDENYTEKFDFSGTHANPIIEDTALYAKWDEIVRTDDGCYEFNKDKKTIIGFGGTGTCGTDIEIPSQIDGVTVEAIGGGELVKDGAFDYEGLTSVKIPDTIKEIQQNAFVNNQLAYISLGNSIEKIGRHAFQGNKLTTIYIPSSVTEIGNWAFSWNAVADVPCSTHLSGYGYGVVGVYLSGDDTQLFSKDTCLQFQQGYSVKYMDGNSIYREDVSTGSVKNIELTGKDYYDFSGWYTDNTFSSKFDFSTVITGNIILFAYWTPIAQNNPTPGKGMSGRGRISTNNGDNEHGVSSDDTNIKDNEDENNKNEGESDSNSNGDYDQELLDAYNWAIKQGIINSTFEDLFNEGELTRAEMAKIAVKYVQMLGLEKKLDEDVSYPDVDSSLGELENYIKLAYQYQVMGIHADGSKLTNFKPNKFVSRGEFATVFSRILHGFEYNINGANYYEKHLEVLKSEGILNDTNPARVEEKKWVILMMYRYQKK